MTVIDGISSLIYDGMRRLIWGNPSYEWHQSLVSIGEVILLGTLVFTVLCFLFKSYGKQSMISLCIGFLSLIVLKMVISEIDTTMLL
jgi:VIT1/CCC1 family predicted Fe2+/Mn2+ transporter